MMQDHEQWSRERAELDAWATASTPDLIRHIMTRYHRETRLGMAELETLAEEAALFEGWRADVLLAVRDEVELFCTEMRAHLRDEETTLFPAILAKEGGRPVDFQHELQEPMGLFEDEHDAAEGLLKRIRVLTNGYEAPQGAPPLQQELYAACKNLSHSLLRHIYLENQILFRRLL